MLARGHLALFKRLEFASCQLVFIFFCFRVILSANPRVADYKNAIRDNCNNTNLKLVMVVLNTKDKQVYDAVKVELCTERASTSTRQLLSLRFVKSLMLRRS